MLDDNIVNAPNKYRETEGTNRDKAKGIVAKPMPRYWHDRHSVNQIEDPEEKRFQLSIVADKKPYFMRIVYPALARQYNTYIKTTNKNARREFGMSVEELEQIPEEDRTERQSDFIRYYYNRIPVGTGDCVMNKICRRLEREFDGYLSKYILPKPFDYSIMKSGCNYSKAEYDHIKKLHDGYRKRLKQYMVYTTYEYVDEDQYSSMFSELRSEFEHDCSIACPNSTVLCDILLDVCYNKSSTKKFAWEMCGKEIINNLLVSNDYSLQYPTLDPDGDIDFGGRQFRSVNVRSGVSDGYCTE